MMDNLTKVGEGTLANIVFSGWATMLGVLGEGRVC